MNDQNTRVAKDKMIAMVINSRYSIDDQIAIMRQKDTKPEEYQAFYEFAEQVKEKVKAEYAEPEFQEQETNGE